MTAMARVNVSWQNWPGAPGLSQFYFFNSAMQTNVDAVRAFFNTVAALLPTTLTITVPGSGDVVESSTGAITDAWSVATPPAVVTASGAGAYAGNAGAVIHWLTSGVLAGRRVRGRTFLVPIVATAYETNGSLTSAALTTLNGACNTFRTTTAANFIVWSRPVKGTTRYDPKTGQAHIVPARPGGAYDVTGHRIPDLAVTLRSRRT